MHALAAIALLSAIFVVPDDPPKQPVVIDIVTINGSGCPMGGPSVSVAPDNTRFAITYGPFPDPVVHVSDGQRKSCQTNLRVHVPAGFTYAIGKTQYQGFAKLAAGATAALQSTWNIQGMPPFRQRIYRFTGPFDEDWSRDEPVEQPPAFMPCDLTNRNLNLTLEMRVAKGTSTTTSHLWRDATAQMIDLHWKRCP